MFEKLRQIWGVKEIRNKILFVVAMLILFRVMAAIPVPGVNHEALANFLKSNELFGLLNIFAGGGLSQLSIVMLGVGPYITATIIIQLLTMIVPALERMAKEEGEEGRRRLNQIMRWLTLPLAVLQSYAIIKLLNQGSVQLITDLSLTNLISILITIAAGTVLLMWIGELISEKGIGNGTSLIIFAGIIAGIPQSIQQTLAVYDPSEWWGMVVFGLIAVVVIAGVIFITEGQRNIPVSYAKRVRGNKLYGGVTTHLPLKVNQAGVIPIIFAISVMLLPGVLAQLLTLTKNQTVVEWAERLVVVFNNQIFYGVAYFLLVIAFTYFYTSVTFDPRQISENIQRQGGFIPGIRPGVNTISYLARVVSRITLSGAIFLGVLAVLPLAVKSFSGTNSLSIGGTALLIVVSVVIETIKQIDAQLTMRDYEGL